MVSSIYKCPNITKQTNIINNTTLTNVSIYMYEQIRNFVFATSQQRQNVAMLKRRFYHVMCLPRNYEI